MLSNRIMSNQSWKHLQLCLVVLCLLIGSGQALAEPSVLALVSDGKVSKYRQAMQGFVDASSYEVRVLDITEAGLDEQGIGGVIDAQHPDLIFTVGARAYLLGEKAHDRIPLLFSSAINWQRFPQSKGVYGVAMEVPLSYQFFMYNYFFPTIKRIGVIYSDRYNREYIHRAKQRAKEMGLELVPQKIATSGEIGNALNALAGRIDALWIVADPLVLASSANLQLLFERTEQAGIPIFSYEPAFRNYGPVLTISAEPRSMGAQASALARSVLSGRVSRNQVQEPVGTHITLNLKQVKKLNLKFNEEALDSVTDIIQ